MLPSCKILSIQSHVVHGYVGNKAAAFPLQLLGYDVDFINSVQFSNHTEYKFIKGQKLEADQLGDLWEGLKLNNLNDYTHLLTGYIGNKATLIKLADIVYEMKKERPNLFYLCDPVLGDNGKWYVPKELLETYVKKLLPKADLITPNLFELELLFGKKITSWDHTLEAINYCHETFKNKIVILSSCKPFDPTPATKNQLTLYASSIDDNANLIRIQFEKIDGYFTGTGDVFSAVLLGWLNRLNGNLRSACEHTVSTMIHILRRTNAIQYNVKTYPLELNLIQSKADIERPEIIVKSDLISKKSQFLVD